MPITVFLVGVLLGTEKYSHPYAANMVVVAIGVATASYGERYRRNNLHPCLDGILTWVAAWVQLWRCIAAPCTACTAHRHRLYANMAPVAVAVALA